MKREILIIPKVLNFSYDSCNIYCSNTKHFIFVANADLQYDKVLPLSLLDQDFVQVVDEIRQIGFMQPHGVDKLGYMV